MNGELCIMGCGRERKPGYTRCVECFREYNRANRERWRKANPERAREICQKYRENHRELEAARSRLYYAKNVKDNPDQQEKARARSKRWYEKNRDKVIKRVTAAKDKKRNPVKYMPRCERLHLSAKVLPCGDTPSCRGCSQCPENATFGAAKAFHQFERSFD